jgi:SAM-dependent methyltransferase
MVRPTSELMMDLRRPSPQAIALALIAALFALSGLVYFGGPVVMDWLRIDRDFQPVVGQRGKDVDWAPTSDALVRAMLETAKVGPNDLVVDLGSGDGKIAIAAARDFGARARGFEYDRDLVDLSRSRAEEAGVADRVKFVRGDIFEEDFADATVVTMYLLPRLNERLKPRILALAPGTRVVSNAYDMGDWRPDMRIERAGERAFVWIVPARAAGVWSIPLTTEERVRVEFVQTYQHINGIATVAGRPAPVVDATLTGRAIAFTIEDWRGGAWRVNGTIEGDLLQGGIVRVGGDVERMIEVTRTQ